MKKGFKYNTDKTTKKKEPIINDFYDEHDPRGISSSEYKDYEKALENFKNRKKK